jgi:hypothetical protein
MPGLSRAGSFDKGRIHAPTLSHHGAFAQISLHITPLPEGIKYV